MADPIGDGGSAFPSPERTLPAEAGYYKQLIPAQSGMSLRDWFAGQALAGLTSRLSNADYDDIRNGIRAGGHEARIAGLLADAMLAEREKGVA